MKTLAFDLIIGTFVLPPNVRKSLQKSKVELNKRILLSPFENPSFFFIERINGSLTFIGGSLWKCGGRFGNLAISLLLKLP